MRENIHQGRQNGYFLNLSENTAEVTGVGNPVSVDGRALGLSVAGPNHRVARRHREMAIYLRESALDIASALGDAGVTGAYS